MPHPIASLLVGLTTTYLGLGAGFALAFVTTGVDRVDPLARGAGWGFRVVIVPGTVLLWPLLLVRWAAGSMAPPAETNAHRRSARRRA